MPALMKPRPELEQAFRCTFTIGPDAYAVFPLKPDLEVARKAYRFQKLTGDMAIYDVYLDENGAHCDCLGHLRWDHCKHVDTLHVMGCLD